MENQMEIMKMGAEFDKIIAIGKKHEINGIPIGIWKEMMVWGIVHNNRNKLIRNDRMLEYMDMMKEIINENIIELTEKPDRITNPIIQSELRSLREAISSVERRIKTHKRLMDRDEINLNENTLSWFIDILTRIQQAYLRKMSKNDIDKLKSLRTECWKMIDDKMWDNWKNHKLPPQMRNIYFN